MSSLALLDPALARPAHQSVCPSQVAPSLIFTASVTQVAHVYPA